MKTILLLITVLILGITYPAFSQPYLVWERFNIAPNNGESFPVDLKIDSNEFVYNLCKEGGYSVYKYDQSGNLIWNTKYNHPGIRLNTKPHSMTVDNLGNVYCVGDNGDEVVTIKIDSAGVLQWVRSYIPGLGFYSAGGIALDPENNIVVIGGSPSNDARIIYGVIKYSQSGDTIWNKVKSEITPFRGGIPKSLKIAKNGDIYFAGYLNYEIGSQNNGGCYLVKLDNNGNQIWNNIFYPQGSLLNLFIDSKQEYLYSVGVISENQMVDVTIFKHDTSGNMIWDVRYDTPEGYSEELRDAIIDSDNNIIFTARSGVISPEFVLTVKYSSNGALLWERRFIEKDSYSNYSFGMYCDNENNIYVTGDVAFLGNIYFSNLIKYNENGDYIWNVLNGTPNRKNTGHKVIKAEDKLYVLGTMLWTNGMFNSILLKYSENPLSVNSSFENLNFKLFQNYPNPFNPLTTITFSIPHSGIVQLNIYNALGQLVSTPVSEHKHPGTYSVTFDASDLPSGVYYYKLDIDSSEETGNYSQTRKMILLK